MDGWMDVCMYVTRMYVCRCMYVCMYMRYKYTYMYYDCHHDWLLLPTFMSRLLAASLAALLQGPCGTHPHKHVHMNAMHKCSTGVCGHPWYVYMIAMYVCMYVWMNVWLYVCWQVYMCMCTCVCVYVYVCMSMCVCAYVCMCVCVYVCMCMYNIYIYI